MLENIKPYLPSNLFVRKIGLLIGVFLVCVGGALLIQKISTKGSQNALNENQTRPLLLEDISVLDINGNSIPDWAETLNDGRFLTSENNMGDAEVNETEQLARDIFTTAASIGQVAPLSEAGSLEIAAKVAERIAATQPGESFTTSDIKLVPQTTKNESAYFASVIKLLDKTYPLDIDNSLAILQTALDQENPSKLNELEPISERYKKLIDAFKALPVPEEYETDHIAFLNILSRARGQIETMRNSFVNPVLTMSTFVNYPETLTELVSFISPFTTKIPYSTLINNTNSGN